MRLYTRQEADKMAKSIRRWNVLGWVLLGLGTGISIALCCLTHTGIDRMMAIGAILSFTLGGWAWILIRKLYVVPVRAKQKHMDSILLCEAQGDFAEWTGTLQRQGEAVHIPGSIDMQKIILQTDQDRQILHVLQDKVSLLPKDETPVTLRAVRKYITEVQPWEK